MTGDPAGPAADDRTAHPPDFDAWVASRGPALLRLALVLTGNTADAEDVVQLGGVSGTAREDALSRALPRAQRTAVVLRFYEQLDYDEIASLTGVREGTVRSRVSRGIAVLRAQLGTDAGVEGGGHDE